MTLVNFFVITLGNSVYARCSLRMSMVAEQCWALRYNDVSGTRTVRIPLHLYPAAHVRSRAASDSAPQLLREYNTSARLHDTRNPERVWS